MKIIETNARDDGAVVYVEAICENVDGKLMQVSTCKFSYKTKDEKQRALKLAHADIEYFLTNDNEKT